MNKKSIQKPAPPLILEYSHFSVVLHWKENFEKFFSLNQVTKLLTEISIVEESHQEGWKKIYIGYATDFTFVNLNANTKYAFRIRFKVNDEWSPYSEPIVVITLEKPMTGEHLHKAIRRNDITELERVLENSKVNIEAQDGLGFTPLMAAAQKSSVDTMKILLKKRADIEAKTDSGKTALMLACFKGEWGAIDTLIEYGANLNNSDRSGLTALHYSVDGESTRSVRILGAAGANIDSVDSVLGWSPLLRCAGLRNNGNIDIAKELIKLGANVNLQDNEGNTAIHLCTINGHVQLFEVLLHAGSDFNIQNKLKNSVLKLAENSDNMAMRQILHQFSNQK